MKNDAKKNLVIASFGVVIILIVLVLVQKQKKEKEVNQIIEDIKTGKGVNLHDIDGLLKNVSADASFSDAISEAERLQGAKGWLWDSDSTVFDVLLKKTKAQLKQVSNELIKIEGLTLGQFVNDTFSGFSDGGKVQRAFDIVNNAR